MSNLRLILNVIIFLLITSAIAFADQTDSATIEKGRQLYLSNKCADCHGSEGKGDGDEAAYFNTNPTNFHDIKVYVQGHKQADIIYSIKHGIKDNQNSGMPSFPHLSDQELQQIASYLVSLQEKK